MYGPPQFRHRGGQIEDRPDYDYAEGLTLRVYAFEDGQHTSVAIPTVTGEIQKTFDVRREGRFITVDHSGKPGAWQVLLAGVPSIDSVEGGAAASSPNGVLLTPKRGASFIKISLKVVI